jgi:hypothetical protein
MKKPTWPRCEWNPVLDTRHTKGPGRKHNCKRLASRSFGDRRPFIHACEVCSMDSKRLRRFKRWNHRIAGMTYEGRNLKTGEIEVVNLERPEAEILNQTLSADRPYRSA